MVIPLLEALKTALQLLDFRGRSPWATFALPCSAMFLGFLVHLGFAGFGVGFGALHLLP
ncbi:hypothetical protein [Streptomyces sp. NPDC089799]|uniref:hypothetical protein n=1 Tax=Streptomyces sp. NPDC089799 TaxID=3155066 RepID=UPI0034241A03